MVLAENILSISSRETQNILNGDQGPPRRREAALMFTINFI